MRRHLQRQKTSKCLRTIAFWFPEPTAQLRAIDQDSKELLKGHHRQQAEAKPKYHTFGPRLPLPPSGWIMPPPPAGYVTKAQTLAILPQEDIADDVLPLLPEQIITDYASPNISDFTPYFVPTRVIRALPRREKKARRRCRSY